MAHNWESSFYRQMPLLCFALSVSKTCHGSFLAGLLPGRGFWYFPAALRSRTTYGYLRLLRFPGPWQPHCRLKLDSESAQLSTTGCRDRDRASPMMTLRAQLLCVRYIPYWVAISSSGSRASTRGLPFCLVFGTMYSVGVNGSGND